MFDDRRTRQDRRTKHQPDQIPPGGCRRRQERRNCWQYQPLPWWLRANYVEELEPPILDTDEVS